MQQCSLPHDHGQLIEQNFDHMPKTEDFQIVADVPLISSAKA